MSNRKTQQRRHNQLTSNPWRQMFQNDGRDQDAQRDRRRKREEFHSRGRTQCIPHPPRQPYPPGENEQPSAIYKAQNCQRLLRIRRCRWICTPQGESERFVMSGPFSTDSKEEMEGFTPRAEDDLDHTHHLQIIYRSSTDHLQIIHRSSTDHLDHLQ